MVYVREGIPAKELKVYSLSENIECGFVEINLKNEKWLLANVYHPPSQNERYFLKNWGSPMMLMGLNMKF